MASPFSYRSVRLAYEFMDGFAQQNPPNRKDYFMKFCLIQVHILVLGFFRLAILAQTGAEFVTSAANRSSNNFEVGFLITGRSLAFSLSLVREPS